MGDIAALAGATLSSDMERMRIISQNLSNASTPGYRAELAMPAGPERFAAALRGTEPPATPTPVRAERAGMLRETQRRLDLAIEGPGYFRLQTPAGVRYTRRGDFTMDASGRVLSQGGFPLLGENGELVLPGAEFEIDARGSVRIGSTSVARILLAMPQDEELSYLGDSLFAASEDLPMAAPEAGRAALRQGALENANVNPLQEMVSLMETVRHVGFSAQALRAYDQMLDASINQTGDF